MAAKRTRDEQPMSWLDPWLREAGPPPGEFLSACDTASRDGLMLLTLRRTAELRRGAAWLSAPAFVRALVAAARVPLAEVTRWAGFAPDLSLEPGFGRAWARLAGA